MGAWLAFGLSMQLRQRERWRGGDEAEHVAQQWGQLGELNCGDDIPPDGFPNSPKAAINMRKNDRGSI